MAEFLLGTGLIIALLALYLLPGFIAEHRGHRSSTAILVLNVLLGWTVIGWIAALIWSCAYPGPPED